jgi:transposase
MSESTTATVALDVHARSIRLAAVRADELLEERTLPYDEEAVERVLRRWPAVRCCYEAGPTGFGLYRRLVEQGIDRRVVAPGLAATLRGAPDDAPSEDPPADLHLPTTAGAGTRLSDSGALKGTKRS